MSDLNTACTVGLRYRTYFPPYVIEVLTDRKLRLKDKANVIVTRVLDGGTTVQFETMDGKYVGTCSPGFLIPPSPLELLAESAE